MSFFELLLAVLGVWRITHLLSREDGPGQVLVRLRRLAGAGFWGELLDCFYCLSLWVALPFAALLGGGWKDYALLWPALSGAAILLERLRASREAARALYIEETENEHVLRKE